VCYSIVYYYNGAQIRAVLIGRWTVSGFDLACLCLPSDSLSLVFMMLYIIFFKLLTSFFLPFSELSLVGLAIDVVD